MIRNTTKTLTFLAGVALASTAVAANGTWDVDANGLWSTTTNWLSGTVADGSGSTANFTNDITADRTVSLNSDRTLTNVVFGDSDTATAGSWILNNNGTSTNNLILAGTTPTITVNALGTGKNATISAIIEGTAGLTKAGAGTLSLTGSNTYTGNTTISAGTLNITNRTAASGQISVANDAILGLGSGNNFSLGTSNFFVGTTSGTATVNHTGGNISFTGGNQLLLGNAVNGIYNLSGGQISTAGVADRGVILGVNSNGDGTFNLSGTGLLSMPSTSVLQISRSDILSISDDNTTGIFNQTGGTANVGVLRMGGAASSQSGGVAELNLSAGVFTAASFSHLSVGPSSTSTINISGTADVTLPNLPTARGSGATATMNFDGGTLKNSATGIFITGLTNAFIKAGGAKFDTSLNSTTVSQNLLTHGVSTGGGLTKEGGNTLTLSGNNTYTGGTTVNAGTLTMGSSSALGSTSGQVTVNTGGTLNMAGNSLTVGNLTGTGGTISGTSGTRTLTIGQGDGTGGNFQGSISNGTGGTTAVTKVGTGTITISGSNAYTGATNVNAGTLRVNGSLASGSTVTVLSGATLGGNGTIGGATTIQGIHDPGNSPGVQTFGSDLAYSGGNTTVNWELTGNTTINTGNSTFDQIIVSGNLTFAAATSLNLSFNGTGSSVLWSDSFWGSNQTWTLHDVSGTTSGSGNFSINPQNWLDSGNFTFNTARPGSSFSLVQSGQDVLIQYVAVPEPAVLALAACGGAIGLGVLRRRR